MKKSTLQLLCCLMTLQLYAQSLGGTNETIAPLYNNLSTFEANKIFSQTYFKDIEGTPYRFKDFTNAEIVGVPTKFLMRYNAFEDVLETKNDKNEIYNVAKEAKFSTIIFQNGLSIVRLIDLNGNPNAPNYRYMFEIAKSGSLELLRHDKVKFTEGRLPRNSFDLGSKPKFSPFIPTYYIIQHDKKVIEFPDSKSKLYALYPKHKAEISEYIKKNEVNFKLEKDLIGLTILLSKF